MSCPVHLGKEKSGKLILIELQNNNNNNGETIFFYLPSSEWNLLAKQNHSLVSLISQPKFECTAFSEVAASSF